MEIITMLTQGIVAGATIAIAVALYYHRQAVMLQRSSLQATMFSEISGRISVILENIPLKRDITKDNQEKSDKKDIVKLCNWYIRLFNELESIVFLQKHGLISPAMGEYYQGFILGYVDKIPKTFPEEEFPEIYIRFRNLPETAFSNLREYYRVWRGKEASLFHKG